MRGVFPSTICPAPTCGDRGSTTPRARPGQKATNGGGDKLKAPIGWVGRSWGRFQPRRVGQRPCRILHFHVSHVNSILFQFQTLAAVRSGAGAVREAREDAAMPPRPHVACERLCALCGGKGRVGRRVCHGRNPLRRTECVPRTRPTPAIRRVYHGRNPHWPSFVRLSPRKSDWTQQRARRHRRRVNHSELWGASDVSASWAPSDGYVVRRALDSTTCPKRSFEFQEVGAAERAL